MRGGLDIDSITEKLDSELSAKRKGTKSRLRDTQMRLRNFITSDFGRKKAERETISLEEEEAALEARIETFRLQKNEANRKRLEKILGDQDRHESAEKEEREERGDNLYRLEMILVGDQAREETPERQEFEEREE
eukprot:scaffold58330_cov50-Attheya_sp.AAC.2